MVQQCGSCRVQFSNSDQYRTHYQSDWHCYNLKRKVAQLPPLGLDEFETRKEKITTEKKNSQNPKEKKDKHRKERKNQKKEKKRDQNWEAGDSPRFRWFCERSAQIEAEESAMNEEEWEDVDSDEEIESDLEEEQVLPEKNVECKIDGINQRIIPINECLFDGFVSPTMKDNIAYMEKEFSFFIPSREYLSDEQGLIEYLHRKVGVGNICIKCNEKGKAFYSLAAVRDHMKRQGCCSLNMTGEAAFEYSEFYDFPDSDEEMDEIEDGNVGELVTSSGAVLGHRSLWRYYKQSFDPRMALVPSKRARQINSFRAIGWYNEQRAELENLREFKKVAKWKKKNQLRVGLRNNKNDYMKHFVRRDGFCQ